MTDAETIETLRRLTLEAIGKRHERMVLSVWRTMGRRRRLPPEHITIAPGLRGRWVGYHDDGVIADVLVTDAIAWLRRRGVVLP